jgi:hypothetical protein
MQKSDFKQWLIVNYPNLKEITIATTVSDAFYIFNHDLGINFQEILNGDKSLKEYKICVEKYLLNSGKEPGSRPSGYTSHLRYLLKYAKELGLTRVDSKLKTIKIQKVKSKRKPRTPYTDNVMSFIDIEDVFNKVDKDPVYGEENKAVKRILKKFPNHVSLEDIMCKISVIDVTHSTHVGIHKKNFSLVDLAKKIMVIKDIDKRIESGDLLLVDEIANINGKNLLSFASKYCACHNQMVYGKDDYFKYDSVVSKAIYYKGRNFVEYSEKLDEIIESKGLINVDRIREKLDLYYWYNNK